MQEENTPALNRRRLLRRAGTVAAGLGAAGVATAMTATPASAANGDAVLVGGETTGTNPTILGSSSSTNAALSVKNTSTGPALHVKPTEGTAITQTAPVGTVYVDDFGDVSVVGGGDAVESRFVNMHYSPTWATMVIPIPPWRYFVSSGDISKKVKGTITGGKVIPTGDPYDSDLELDFSSVIAYTYGDVAIQANLTVVGTGGGYAALWDQDAWPENSSINYSANVPIANYTQTLLGDDLRLRLKVTTSAIVILDIVGFVVSDPFTQFAGTPGTAVSRIGALGGKGRRPVTRR